MNVYAGRPCEVFERYMVPTIFAPWSVVHLAAVALHEGDRVLDVACGTGILARQAAALVGSGGRVVALDIDPQMLETGRAATDGLPIEWRHGDALALPFADGTFDVGVSQQGLQFVADRLRALLEMRGVLGKVAVDPTFLDDIEAELRSWTSNGSLALPITGHIATGSVW
jgi:ubiquinone/menaquinone biosynthesis C-methylase UbiE